MSGRFGDLSRKQEEILQQFKENVKDVLKPDHDDYYVLRWLRARKFDLKKSEAMLRNHIAWRKKNGVDTILDEWTCPEVVEKYFTGGLFGYDKEDNPVWIDPFGHIDMKGILRSAKKTDVVKSKIQLLEKLYHVILPEETEKRGKRVEQLLIVYDLAKLGLKHLWKPGVDTYCEMISMFEDHYPETLRYAIVINAPRFFPIAYNIVRPFLSEETANKVIICGSNYKDELMKYINPDQLPVCYGGTCQDPDGDPTCQSKVCQGGDVPKTYYKKQMDSSEMENAKLVTVGRGSSEQIECDITICNSAIRWQFSSDGYDIGFGVFRKTKGEYQKASKMEEVVPSERVTSHLVPEDGSVTCKHTGTYVIRFDNTYSWTRSKKIHYLLEVLEPDIEDFPNSSPSDSYADCSEGNIPVEGVQHTDDQ